MILPLGPPVINIFFPILMHTNWRKNKFLLVNSTHVRTLSFKNDCVQLIPELNFINRRVISIFVNIINTSYCVILFIINVLLDRSAIGCPRKALLHWFVFRMRPFSAL